MTDRRRPARVLHTSDVHLTVPGTREEAAFDAALESSLAAVPDGPADQAGIEAGDEDQRFQVVPVTVGGDVIVSVDGQDVVAEADLAEAIAEHSPGDTIELENDPMDTGCLPRPEHGTAVPAGPAG